MIETERLLGRLIAEDLKDVQLAQASTSVGTVSYMLCWGVLWV
jgi:hypothetical protein